MSELFRAGKSPDGRVVLRDLVQILFDGCARALGEYPRDFFQSGVRISPRFSAFTRMFSLMSSFARHLENITRAALLVL